MNESFRIVNNYLGWGAPENGVWFVGIEEAGEWQENSEAEIKEKYSCLYKPDTQEDRTKEKGKKEGAGIRYYTSQIVCPLSKMASGHNFEYYRDNILWGEGTGVFQSNLYPLGKPNVKSWPPHYKELFGFSEDQLDEYKSVVRDTRFEKIRDFWQVNNPQATICFGSTFWEDFRSLFSLPIEPDESFFDGKIRIYNNNKVILTYFFDNRSFNSEMAEKIVDVLKTWNVSLP